MTSRALIPRLRPLNRTLRTQSRPYATQHPHPPPPPPPPPPHPQQPPSKPQTRTGTFYKSFGSPVLKCFLGALFTYQVTYWGWMKLESLEEKRGFDDEIKDLKNQLKNEVVKKIEAGKDKAGEIGVGGESSSGGKGVVEASKASGKKGWLW